MKLSYGQLSTIVYSIVYDEAANEEIEDIDSLIDYLNEHEDESIMVLNDDQ